MLRKEPLVVNLKNRFNYLPKSHNILANLLQGYENSF